MAKLEESLTQRWACGGCSFLNDRDTSACAMCGTKAFVNVAGPSSRDGRANSRQLVLQARAHSLAPTAVSQSNGGRSPTRSGAQRGTRTGTQAIGKKGAKADVGRAVKARVDEPTGFLGQSDYCFLFLPTHAFC